MKKTFPIFLTLLTSVCAVSAQNLEMLSGNPQWIYATYRNHVFQGAELNAQIDDASNGFLEVGGRKYHRLFQTERLDSDNGEVVLTLVEPVGVREDNGKVYVLCDDFQKQVARLSEHELNAVDIPYRQTSDSELLLYDFTLQTGDRYPTSEAYGDLYVEKVEHVITHDAKSRKLFTLTNGLQILEGIGCLNSRNGNLLYYLYSPEAWKHNNDSYYNQLYEYKKDGNIIYEKHDASQAQKYFPEGTKWTEIRLDREKYDSWYSQVGDEWIPNFETVEYQIQGSYIKDFWKDGDFKTFNCVHTNSTENSDSLFLILYEGGHDWEDNDWVEVTPYFYDEDHMLWPGQAYMFNWEIGTSLYSRTIEASNCTDMDEDGTHEFGMITEIMEGSFGGVKPLKYVEMNGVRIIQGIGVTEWNDGECLFGPVDPYTALCTFQPGMDFEERHYRSMLVYFERDGDVLYNMWPDKNGNGIHPIANEKIRNGGITYDLSGRRVDAKAYENEKLKKGIYIKDGRKLMVR